MYEGFEINGREGISNVYINIYKSFLPFGNNLNIYVIYAQIIPECSNRRNERPIENGDK